MLRVLAIDDEPLALRQIVSYIRKTPDLQLIAECRSAIEAQEVLARETVDALFCDINMPDLSGMDFVRQLTTDGSTARQPLVVFTTAYSQYAVEGFKVAAVDYLLKPFSFADFTRSVERLRQRIETTVIYVRADHRSVAVAMNDIIRIQAMGEYLRLFVAGLPRPLMTLMAMKRMEEEVPPTQFMRVHRSHIINLSHVAEVSHGRILLDDGAEVPLGDNHRAAFDQWLSKHTLGRG